jgi:hypothetical protein
MCLCTSIVCTLRANLAWKALYSANKTCSYHWPLCQSWRRLQCKSGVQACLCPGLRRRERK